MKEQERLVGNSTALLQTLDEVSRLASVNRPVLILGERGTGKELVAERLHYLSPRWDAPLFKLNCAAVAESLLESEMFGHEPGAFTGATRIHRGYFERANGGTLFLDELGNMSSRLQEKLLRVVEYGEFERLGGQETLEANVRVLGATNSDLKEMAARGEFREDLLDRLSFDVIHLPALRQRRGDVAELARHFAVQMSIELGWDLFAGFTTGAMEALENYTWPGNVRELKSAVERSLHRWGDPDKAVDDIVIDPFRSPFGETPKAKEKSLEMEENKSPVNFSQRMLQIEAELVRDALHQNGNHQRRTADALGLSYDQLRGLVRKHKLSSRSPRGARPRQ